MKFRKLTFWASLSAICSCTGAIAQTTAYTIQGFGTVLMSSANGGSEWADSFQFRVGGLSGPFNPATQFLSLPTLWKDLSAPIGGNYLSAFDQFSGVGSLSTPLTTFANNEQLYLWGYNTRSAGDATEWLLLTSSSWTTGTVGSSPSVDFNTTVPFQVLLGIFSPGSNDFDGTFTSFNAVPEPSTYALVVGLSALGFVGYRRFRQRRDAVGVEAAKA